MNTSTLWGVLPSLLLAATVTAASAAGQASGPWGDNAGSIAYGVALCTDAQQPNVDKGTRAAVIRAIVPGSRGKEVGFRVVECKALMPDATCFAQQRVLVCRAAAIERTLRAAAWAAFKYTQTKATSYDDFRLQSPRWNVDAVRYGDHLDRSAEVDAELAKLKDGYGVYQSSGLAADASRLPADQQIFNATIDYVLAALLGHELSHVLGEQCPLTQHSRTEELGLVNRFLSLHQTGELFCPRAPTVEEVRADVCGLRHIREATQSLANHSGEDQYAVLARRLSADLISFDVTFGWRPRPGVPDGKYPFMELNEYLYAPMRVLAFSSELTPPTKGTVAVCGEAASLFAHGTQELFKSCPAAKGIIADDILALLPPAVEAAWNGEKWTPRTVACVGR